MTHRRFLFLVILAIAAALGPGRFAVAAAEDVAGKASLHVRSLDDGTLAEVDLERGEAEYRFTAPSGNTSYIPVFVLADGKITADYRGSFVVPAYE